MKKEVIALTVMACLGVATFAEPIGYGGFMGRHLGLVGPGIGLYGNGMGLYPPGYGWGGLYGLHGLGGMYGGFSNYGYGFNAGLMGKKFGGYGFY